MDMMKKGLRSFLGGLGLGLIGFTHLYMLVFGLPASMMTGHAIVNLGAGVVLAFAVFKK